MGLLDRHRRVRLLQRRPGRGRHRGRGRVHPVDHRGSGGLDVRRPATAGAGPRRGLCHPRALDGGDRGGAGGRSPIRGVPHGDRRRDEHHARPPGARRAPPRGRAEAGRAGGRKRGVGNGRRARRAPRPAVGRAADCPGRPGRRLRCQRAAGARSGRGRPATCAWCATPTRSTRDPRPGSPRRARRWPADGARRPPAACRHGGPERGDRPARRVQRAPHDHRDRPARRPGEHDRVRGGGRGRRRGRGRGTHQRAHGPRAPGDHLRRCGRVVRGFGGGDRVRPGLGRRARLRRRGGHGLGVRVRRGAHARPATGR